MFWSPESSDNAPITSVQLFFSLAGHNLDSGSLSRGICFSLIQKDLKMRGFSREDGWEPGEHDVQGTGLVQP